MAKENKVDMKKVDVSIWVLFTAAFLIIVFFLWYFFIYVKSNEEFLIQKNFRVLTQLGENFKGRYESLQKVVESTDMKAQLTDNKDEIEKYFFGIGTVDSGSPIDNSYIYFKGEKNEIAQKQHLIFRIKKQDFFQPLERKDVFEQLIIIKEGTGTKSGKGKNELFYSSFPGDIVVKNLDSLVSDNNGLSSGTIADVEILGIDYKLFLTHILLQNDKSYFVGGVISDSRYAKETRAINIYISLLIVIIFFTFLLGIPLIKLKVISENQKLQISDLLLSSFSIIFGTLFILLIIFNVITYSRGKEKVNESLINLSDSIYASLTDEIKKIDYTLDLYMKGSLVYNDSIHLTDKTYNYFKLIFRLNPKGDQDDINTLRAKKSSKDNYKYRRYFTESGEWELDGRKLMLDFIYSSTSGEQLGVVSKKKGDFVYVITSRFYSVINTILPPGYGFCVIDNEGNVKFHSDANKMLRENFIEETENPGELTGAIYGNLKLLFPAKYLGKSHSCYITPIGTLPLYLVTFFDDSYSNSIDLQITSLTILFSFLLLLIFFTIVIGSRIIVYRKSLLSRNIDIVEWLRPSAWKTEIFRRSTVANMIAMILVAFSCLITDAANTLFMIFLFVPLQIIAVFYYTNFLVSDPLQKKYSKVQFVPALFFIICIIYLVPRTNADIGLLLTFCAWLILSDLLILRFLKLSNSKPFSPRHFYNYLSSWLGLIVVMPVIIFSIIFFNHEVSSNVLHSLYSYASRESTRDYDIDKFYSDYVDPSFYRYKGGSKLKGVYYPAGISKSKDSTEFLELKKENLNGTLHEILFYLKPDFDQLSSERKRLVKEIPGFINESIQTSSDSIIIKYSAYQTYYSTNDDVKTSYFKGKTMKFGFAKPELFILFLLILLLNFYIVYKTIKFTSERIFGISIQKKASFIDSMKQYLKTGNNLVIQCVGMCEKDIDFYLSQRSISAISYNDPRLLEIITNQPSDDSIYIKNINPEFEHPEKEEEKFSAINKLIKKGNNQIVLISNQSIEKLIEITKSTIKLEKDDNILKSLKRLKAIFELIDNNFIHLYAPVNGIANPSLYDELTNMLKQAKIPEEANKIIKDELIVLGLPDDSIKKYAIVLIEYAENEKSKSGNLTEKIILKVQELATTHYERIWESCTHEEKLMLMDMADNLLLNDKNKKIIEKLISKGLLKKDISIDIINRSFRNYVNTKYESDLEREYLKVRKAGKWANYRAPILLVLFAIAFFLVLQENILTSIASILPVVLSIITIITKISGVFSGNGSKSAPAS